MFSLRTVDLRRLLRQKYCRDCRYFWECCKHVYFCPLARKVLSDRELQKRVFEEKIKFEL